jgi:hypothetical protein
MNWKGCGRKRSYIQYYQRNLPQMTNKNPSLEGTTFLKVYIKHDGEDCMLQRSWSLCCRWHSYWQGTQAGQVSAQPKNVLNEGYRKTS